MKKIAGWAKDENGFYIKENPKVNPLTKEVPAAESSPADINIDSLMGKGLLALDRLMKVILTDISTGIPERDTVMNLKDVMGMLHILKAKEEADLALLPTDQLKKMSK